MLRFVTDILPKLIELGMRYSLSGSRAPDSLPGTWAQVMHQPLASQQQQSDPERGMKLPSLDLPES